MPKADWQVNTIQKIFERAELYPAGIKTVLDVGCGLSFKSQYIDAELRVGLDAYRPFLEKVEVALPNTVLINADAKNLHELFLPDSFDMVLLLDIIEHMGKSDAYDLISSSEEIARSAVIIETPQGYVPQNIDIWGCGGHYYQTHRSGWKREELEALGYIVLAREYKMSSVRRHTELEVDPDIVLLDAIKIL